MKFRRRVVSGVLCALCGIAAARSNTAELFSPLYPENNAASFRFYRRIDSLRNESYCNRLAHSYADKLTAGQKLSQMLLISADGKETFWAAPDFKKGFLPGGFIIFARNIADTPAAVMAYTDSITAAFAEYPYPFLVIDHEGGAVNRLRKITSPLPSPRQTAASFSEKDAYSLYYHTGVQLKSLGFTVNLAPLAEVETPENAGFLDSRSFGSARQVLCYGAAAVRGYDDAGVYAVLKHFPGNTNDDPHKLLPYLHVSEQEFYSGLAAPFRILSAIRPTGILLSHAVVPCIDELPSCLSEKMVSGVLRTTLAFDGLVFSDDICMSAFSGGQYSPQELFVQAVEAGVDIVMSSDPYYAYIVQYAAEYAATHPSFSRRIDDAFFRICRKKAEMGLLPETAAIRSVDERLSLFNEAYKNASNLYRSFVEVKK